MGNRILALTVAAFLLCECTWAQTDATVVGSGAAPPVPITVAPGELATIFVAGIGANLSDPVVATTIPLPTTLAGISVTLRQPAPLGGTLPVPLLAIFPVPTCRAAPLDSCGELTGVTLQIPFELATFFGVQAISIGPAQLVVQEGNSITSVVEIFPRVDNIHVLRLGDTISTPGTYNTDLSILPPIVTHADGTMVTKGSPAQAGETLVMYAVGLGQTLPSVTTGEASPAPAPEALAVLDFNFQPDAAPTKPIPSPQAPLSPGTTIPPCGQGYRCSASPSFVGLTPGYVGLYQINFVVPAPPAGYGPCAMAGQRSNLTVSIGGVMSFDGAGICVAPLGGTSP
jgi:uncharacterized protein (TIGR03437 family)